jgi:hypothetical protein
LSSGSGRSTDEVGLIKTEKQPVILAAFLFIQGLMWESCNTIVAIATTWVKMFLLLNASPAKSRALFAGTPAFYEVLLAAVARHFCKISFLV